MILNMVVEDFSVFFFFNSPVMGLEPTALYMLGKFSTMEVHTSLATCF